MEGSQHPCCKFDSGQEKISTDQERIAKEKKKRGRRLERRRQRVPFLTPARLKRLRGAVRSQRTVFVLRGRGEETAGKGKKKVISFICVFVGVCFSCVSTLSRGVRTSSCVQFSCYACLLRHNYLVIFVKVFVLVLQQVLHCLLAR